MLKSQGMAGSPGYLGQQQSQRMHSHSTAPVLRAQGERRRQARARRPARPAGYSPYQVGPFAMLALHLASKNRGYYS